MLWANFLDNKSLFYTNNLSPPLSKKRKEITNEIQSGIKDLLYRLPAFKDCEVSRSYKEGLNFFVRFSNSPYFIKINFDLEEVKVSLLAYDDFRIFDESILWKVNSSAFNKISNLVTDRQDSLFTFHQETFPKASEFNRELTIKLLKCIEHKKIIQESILTIKKELTYKDYLYFDENAELLVDLKEFENLFNVVDQKLNFQNINDELLNNYFENSSSELQLKISHINMPLAFKYIYPYKDELTKEELKGIYKVAIEAFLVCIHKYEAKASFSYYVSTRLFANTSRYRSLIIRNRLESKYGDKPTFQQIDDYIKKHRNQNDDEYPLLKDIIKYFEPIIKDKLVNKEIKEKKDTESKYLKSSIPVLYNLITGKGVKYENRDIYETFMQELIKSFKYIFDKKEEFIIRKRYLSDLGSKNSSPITTLEEVGLALEISRERVRQIEKKALLKLQSVWKQVVPFEEKNIDFFLPISPPYLSRSKEVKELVKTLESKGYFYKGMITKKPEIVEEIGQSLKTDPLALKKYINYLSENKTSQQSLSPTSEKNSFSLETELADLGFSMRASNVFLENQISTLGQLISYSEEDLMYMTNFGNTTLNEVVEKLKNYGLKLPDQSKGNKTLKTNLSNLSPEIKIIYISLMDIGGKGTIKEIHAAVLKYQKDKPESSIRRALQQYSPRMKHYTGKHVFNQVSSGTYELANIDTSGYFD